MLDLCTKTTMNVIGVICLCFCDNRFSTQIEKWEYKAGEK